MLGSPQNTNESIRSVDMMALCEGLLGPDSLLPNQNLAALAASSVSPPTPPHTCSAFLIDDATADMSPCWGGLLRDDLESCVAGFTTGKAHFKNKFCQNCRKTLTVPASRVRALTPELKTCFSNYLRAGFWKTASEAIGGGEVRIANNTITCDGPWLVVYRKGTPVPDLPWAPMPVEWVSEGGVVKFSVAKGTLVPVAEMGQRPGKRPPPSYVGTVDSQENLPKRQRRVNKAARDLSTEDLPAELRLPGVTVAPVETKPPAVSKLVACARSSSTESGASTMISTDQLPPLPTTRAPPAAVPTAAVAAKYESLAHASPALVAAASTSAAAAPLSISPPPSGAAIAKAHLAATVVRPATLVVSSPTLSSQPTMPSASSRASPPGDPMQLAVRLVAAHEHIAGLLESALKPLSPLRHQMSPEQATNLYEQLNKTRGMIEDCMSFARSGAVQPPPTHHAPPAAAAAEVREESQQGMGANVEHAFDSLVQAANEATAAV